MKFLYSLTAEIRLQNLTSKGTKKEGGKKKKKNHTEIGRKVRAAVLDGTHIPDR